VLVQDPVEVHSLEAAEDFVVKAVVEEVLLDDAKAAIASKSAKKRAREQYENEAQLLLLLLLQVVMVMKLEEEGMEMEMMGLMGIWSSIDRLIR
jgi:hypothetical protein